MKSALKAVGCLAALWGQGGRATTPSMVVPESRKFGPEVQLSDSWHVGPWSSPAASVFGESRIVSPALFKRAAKRWRIAFIMRG